MAVANTPVKGGVKTEQVFPGLSVLRKNKKMEVLYPEKKGKIGPALECSPAISADVFSGNSTSKICLTFFSGNSTSKMRLTFFSGNSTSKMRLTFRLAVTFGLAATTSAISVFLVLVLPK